MPRHLPRPPAAGVAFRARFAAGLRAARRAAGMTQAAAGAAAGASRSQWSLWEAGKQGVRVEAVAAFLHAAGAAGGRPARIVLAAAIRGLADCGNSTHGLQRGSGGAGAAVQGAGKGFR